MRWVINKKYEISSVKRDIRKANSPYNGSKGNRNNSYIEEQFRAKSNASKGYADVSVPTSKFLKPAIQDNIPMILKLQINCIIFSFECSLILVSVSTSVNVIRYII